MKYKKKIYRCFLLFISIFTVLNTSCDDYAKAPKRLPNIPESTVWKGGQDGGFWFLKVSQDKNKKIIRFKIFNDHNGKLVFDADFKIPNDCEVFPDSIINSINYFDYSKIVLTNNCQLLPQFPYHYGDVSD